MVGRLKRVGEIILLIAIIAGLYISSSQPYSQQDLRGPISQYVDENAVSEQWKDFSFRYGKSEVSIDNTGAAGMIEFFLRKGTHFTVFALLTAAWYRVLRQRLTAQSALPWSGFLSLTLAVLDEWHQTFTPDRTGQVADVVLDGTGIVTMLLVIAAGIRWKSKKSK
ncbi:VanZ family protein [Brevibacillus ruminantium]|uniref:VanZ family protein n=1 Tax=Brevibacillus ruminantium TaxID=2950604 RepID=A0ABY4WHU8_9BACL|nr:VanZ family protein [Brevibacillus ruminantium]USG66682.1 VanZ family protein [Brevibacillus ruminantium]